MNFSKILQSKRTESGLTQAKLAALSDVSLPMLQLIEAGKTNPSIETIQKLFKPLGLELSYKAQEPDLGHLIECGLPLDIRIKRAKIPVSLQDLLQTIRNTATYLSEQAAPDFRYLEAYQSLLLALKYGYPTLFKKNFEKSSAAMSIIPRRITGRHIKLKRIASARLAEIIP